MNLRLIAAGAVLLLVAACHTRTGDGIATGKEYIAAATPGTTPQERQLDREQWIVNVEMLDGGRRVNVLVDKPVWDRITVGQRLRVTYREGKYTGTIWGADIVAP